MSYGCPECGGFLQIARRVTDSIYPMAAPPLRCEVCTTLRSLAPAVRNPVEYDCADCGVHVYAFGIRAAPVPPRCATCKVVRSLPAGADREDIRAALLDDEAMAYWVERGSYTDESYPPRACDTCGQFYQGPALYCCHACAIGDA